MFMRTLRRPVGLLLIVTFLAWTACDKNPTEDESAEAPTLPPASSMQIDLSAFNQSSLQKATSLSKLHFTNAAARLFLINAIVTLELAIPVVVFAAAASQQPELQGDGKFHWIFSVDNAGNTFEADLAGWIDIPHKQAVWEMYITCNTFDPALDEFLWYTGRSEIEEQSGYWLFYDHTKAPEQVELAQIDWTVIESDDRTLLFTGIDDEISHLTLEYRLLGSDCTVTLIDASEEAELVIHWDTTTGAGCLTAPDYNEGVESCWDENQNDI